MSSIAREYIKLLEPSIPIFKADHVNEKYNYLYLKLASKNIPDYSNVTDIIHRATYELFEERFVDGQYVILSDSIERGVMRWVMDNLRAFIQLNGGYKDPYKSHAYKFLSGKKLDQVEDGLLMLLRYLSSVGMGIDTNSGKFTNPNDKTAAHINNALLIIDAIIKKENNR